MYSRPRDVESVASLDDPATRPSASTSSGIEDHESSPAPAHHHQEYSIEHLPDLVRRAGLEMWRARTSVSGGGSDICLKNRTASMVCAAWSWLPFTVSTSGSK